MKAGMGLNPMGHSHYTDHLAVVCIAMKIPLLFTDEGQFKQATRLYPDLLCLYRDWNEITPSELVTDLEVLLISDIWTQDEYLERFGEAEKTQDKHLRVVHCPHGYSDKDFWIRRCAEEDIALVYGPRMQHMLQEQLVDPHATYVLTGNLRYTYYKSRQTHFDKVVKQDVFNQFAKKQPTILYAPTWRDAELSTSFFDVAEQLLQQLPDRYNLVVKLHPNLEEEDIARVYQIMAQNEDRGNVCFVRQYPLIYPILAHCDLFIGDRSAVGYDFLTFNRPMFFLKQTPHEDYLHRCGTQIQPEDFSRIFGAIEDALPRDSAQFSLVRQEVYKEAFGDREKTLESVGKNIVTACDTPACRTGWRR